MGKVEAMPGGRPPKGPELVERLEGSGEAKRKLKLILETLSGQKTIAEVCEELGIGEAMFHVLRTRTLQEAIEGLEPRPLGRPPKAKEEAGGRIEDLKREHERLTRELQVSRAREDLAVSGLLGKGKGVRKKTKR